MEISGTQLASLRAEAANASGGNMTDHPVYVVIFLALLFLIPQAIWLNGIWSIHRARKHQGADESVGFFTHESAQTPEINGKI